MRDQLSMIEEHPGYQGETLAEYKEKKAAFEKENDEGAVADPPKYLQGSLILIDNQTGAVLAQVGGRSFQDSMFDRTDLGRYRTGTLFKPFVYASAFEKGFFPGTLLEDSPMNNSMVMVGGLSGILGEWGTENPTNVYDNSVTARQALARGKNSATIRMGIKAGLPEVVKTAEMAGLDFQGDLKKFNATMLGRNPASVNQMAVAYTIFPNGGTRPEKTYLISNIRDADGNVIHSASVVRAKEEPIDRYTAFQVNSILSDSFDYGTAKKAKERYGLGDYPVAGKTGTEYNYTDNWFAGYTSELTCVAWIGFDKRKKIYDGAVSSDTVLPVWTKVMNAAAKVTDPQPFRPPADAEEVEICLKSGELACDDCYETVADDGGISSQVRCTYVEHLRPNTNLTAICHIHSRGGTLRQLRSFSSTNPSSSPRASRVLVASAETVLPVAPTIIGEDPYRSLKPVVRATVATPVPEVEQEPEIGKNGLPITRPVISIDGIDGAIPNRVQLSRPGQIVFD